MYTKKQIEKYKRAKYIRELERFINKTINFFQKESIDKNSFKSFIDHIFIPLEDIEKIDLNSSYHIELEKLVETIANLPLSSKDIDEIKKISLHGANRVQMVKRKKNFTKDKHKKSFIEKEERYY